MNAQPTMTPEEQAAWERKAQAGQLFREPETFPRRNRSQEVRDYLAEHYPDRVVPWGHVAEMSLRFGVATSLVSNVIQRTGWTVAPRPGEEWADARGTAVVPGMRGAGGAERVRFDGPGADLALEEVPQRGPGGDVFRMKNHIACGRCGLPIGNIVKHYERVHGGLPPVVRRTEGDE